MGTHTHWWGSPKVMGGEFKEENKPEPWELSPYELGREYAYHHRVSGKTAAWIVAYCVALIWAVLEGAVGAPAHRIDAKGNAGTLITHPWSSPQQSSAGMASSSHPAAASVGATTTIGQTSGPAPAGEIRTARPRSSLRPRQSRSGPLNCVLLASSHCPRADRDD